MHAREVLERNFRRVEERIAAACARAGRRREDVTLVAVTKSVGPEVAALLPELGVNDLGESRPQTLWSKAATLPPTIRWHVIGHLQRNKLERTLPLAHMIHSVDSRRLLDAIEAECARTGRPVDVLLEANASRDANKGGFAPEELPTLTERLHELRGLRVRGLMTMAALAEDAEAARPTFAQLRVLRDHLCSGGLPLEHLSMGMTNDFEVAIEEGATLVRIGTALFEGLVP